MVWILRSIDPSIFNVVSDFMGQATAGVLIFALSASYPYFVYKSVKNGNGVSIENLLRPPDSLPQACIQFYKEGGPRSATTLIYGLIFLLSISTLSHPLSDLFLRFENVVVSTRDTWLLGENTTNTPFYSLLGDAVSIGKANSNPVQRLLSRVDYVANGLSRFSCVRNAQSYFNLDPVEINGISTLVNYYQWSLKFDEGYDKTRTIPHIPRVECVPWESVETKEMVETTDLLEQHENNITHTVLEMTVDNTFAPSCDYEKEIPIDDDDTTTSTSIYQNKSVLSGIPVQDGWRAISRTTIYRDVDNHDDNLLGYGPGKDFSLELTLSPEETKQPIDRGENWKLGRRIRDNLVIMMGGPSGSPIELKYSVISWPIADYGTRNDGKQWKVYAVSSWTHSCPVYADDNYLPVVDLSAFGYGCIINWGLICTVFPEDAPYWTVDETAGRDCSMPSHLDVIEVENLEIDHETLAVYMGTMFRNNGFIYTSKVGSNIAVNAIAAAYIVTREVVNGALPVSDIRPSINAGYIILLILPLLFAIPLVIIWRKKPTKQIPQHAWDSMVFGHREAEEIGKLLKNTSLFYPPPPPDLKFGLIEDGHLGLGTSFVRKRDIIPTSNTMSPAIPFGAGVAPVVVSPNVTSVLNSTIPASNPATTVMSLEGGGGGGAYQQEASLEPEVLIEKVQLENGIVQVTKMIIDPITKAPRESIVMHFRNEQVAAMNGY